MHVYCKWQLYDVWFLRYVAWQTQYFVILDHFLPFYPLKNPKNHNFDNIKKMLKSSFYMCTKNPCISRCTVSKTWSEADTISCHLGSFFGLLQSLPPPLMILKIKILKKWKKWKNNIILLHMYNINEDYMVSGSWNISQDRQDFLSIVISGHYFYESSKAWLKKTKNCCWNLTSKI